MTRNEFREYCNAGVKRWLAGADLDRVVDAMQSRAMSTGLVSAIGQDAVQAIMSEAFLPYRRPGDGGKPP